MLSSHTWLVDSADPEHVRHHKALCWEVDPVGKACSAPNVLHCVVRGADVQVFSSTFFPAFAIMGRRTFESARRKKMLSAFWLPCVCVSFWLPCVFMWQKEAVRLTRVGAEMKSIFRAFVLTIFASCPPETQMFPFSYSTMSNGPEGLVQTQTGGKSRRLPAP